METTAAEGLFSNYDAIVSTIRSGMCSHTKQIRVTFSYEKEILDELPEVIDFWMREAMEETGQPTEGDYLKFQIGGYEKKCSYQRSKNGYDYTITIRPKYYMYLAQEEEVTTRIAELFEELGLNGSLSAEEKIYRIYDYLCRTVSYDKVHKKNSHYYLRSTAYAALVQKTATCQGYSVALYRLLKEAGIDNRIVTGSSSGDDLHAWNLVELDRSYYHLDATWDSSDPAEGYIYYLKGANGLTDHILDETFLTETFQKQYPIAETDYNK